MVYRSQGKQPGYGGGQSINEVWQGNYLSGGYFDDAGHLRPELVERIPMEKLAQAMADSWPQLTSSQVRRYFGHCRSVESKILAVPKDQQHEKWLDLYKDIKMLDAVAAKATTRGNEKIPALFAEFITRNANAVKNSKDFLQGFMYHFEALVGFGSHYFKNR